VNFVSLATTKMSYVSNQKMDCVVSLRILCFVRKRSFRMSCTN